MIITSMKTIVELKIMPTKKYLSVLGTYMATAATLKAKVKTQAKGCADAERS